MIRLLENVVRVHYLQREDAPFI